MKYDEGNRQLARLREQISAIRSDMREVLAAMEPRPVDEHVFDTLEGPVALTALFGRRDELIVIHNMGSNCAYCTLWADGYNGLYPHLKRRAAFVVASPDPPQRQAEFARERGWRFPMVSDRGATFAAKMGYATADGHCRPGLSVLQRHSGRLLRVVDTASCPHDDFCALWHLFDLLPGGAAGWRPTLNGKADE
ncbi:DUF899 family protein [Hyphomicrobium sp.]|uniref:DUF899 family protein n=1 Tax=Hyphomicrobium sp. TaxID=82 RepID=UPI002FE04C34